jgi:arylsulfatase
MTTPPSRPAIILITCDELRADALSCYGGMAVETPHLDRLAREGVRFDRAYTASPWCLPSRSSIITGLYPHNHRAYSNFRDCRLDPARPNLYGVLRGAGYRTAHVGKCHYAPVPYGETRPDRTLPYGEFRDHYLSLGIDDLDLQDDKQVSVWFRDDYAAELDEAGHLAAYRAAVWDRSASKVFDFPGPAEWHPDAWVGRKAVARIREHGGQAERAEATGGSGSSGAGGHAADQPLFLWVSFSGPHFPFDAPAEYHARVREGHVGTGAYKEGEFDDPRRIHHTSYHGGGGIEGAGSAPERGCKHYTEDYWRRLRRTYFANVALLDDQVGEVLRAVEERFGDNALVLFSTDHGEMLGNHRLWGKNNCAYEDVWRVPLLARYPAGSAGARALHGATVDSLVMLTDLAPTCLRAAGLEGAMPTDGLPLEDQAARGGRPYVFAEGEQFLVVGDGHTTYVTANRKGEVLRELFDLDADPHQFDNVVDRPEYAARRLRLHEAAERLFMDALLA